MSTDLVIILSSDWVGSTATRAQLGEEPADALQEVHDTLLRRVIAAEGGTVVKHYGDGVLATFNSATAALGAAVKIQQDFAASRASPDALARMDLRIGLSAGDIKHQAGDIFGLPVVEAVRLQSAAAPNEILCSDLVRVLSQGRGGFEFEDAGMMELKSLPAPVHALKVRRSEPGAAVPTVSASPVSVSPAVAPGGPAAYGSRRLAIYALAALLAIAVVALLADRWLREDTPVVDSTPTPQAALPVAVDATEATQPAPPSIAVLPFTNMSSDPEQEYFSDGLSEELLNQLAHLPNLRVIGRTSSFAFKGKNEDLRTIGETLGVNHILEGSVRKAGNRLRIMAQLINPADGSHLWSETYERNLDDIFAIQEEIAKAVATALEITLGVGELAQDQERLVSSPAVNTRAYELYLLGRHYRFQRTILGFEQAIESYKQALQYDSNYAPSYAELADCYMLLGEQGGMPQQEAGQLASNAIQKALALNDKLADAYSALGLWKSNYEWNWMESEKAFKKAIDLNPGSADAYRLYGRTLGLIGRFDEAIQLLEKAKELDPLSPTIMAHIGQVFIFARQYKKAEEQLQQALKVHPNHALLLHSIGELYIAQGRYVEAIAPLKQSAEMSVSDHYKAMLGYAYAKAGQSKEAMTVLKELQSRSDSGLISGFNLAAVYLALGEKEQSLQQLEKGYEQRDVWLKELKAWPWFDSLHNEPRYKNLMQRMNFPGD